MAMQEFLASYAVEVDEAGLKRLQEALEGNREKAAAAATAFLAAKAALDHLFSGEEGQLPDLKMGEENEVSLVPVLDLTGAEDALNSFKTRMEALRPKLRVNPTGITSAVSSAISSVRSMLASVSVQVPVRAVAQLDTGSLPSQVSIPGTITATGSGNTGNTGGTTTVTPPAGIRSRVSSPSGLGGNQLQAYGQGGRVEKPTLALIAEEGQPEYVIPTGREDRAVPLLREVLQEISASARNAVWAGAGLPEAALSAGLRDLQAATRSAMYSPVVKGGDSYRSVQAPVTIQVSSPAAAPEEVGRYVYDMARRHLIRTMQGVFS